MGIVGSLGFDNMVEVGQAELGRAIGMRSTSVNRAWKVLVACDYLRELEVQGPLGLRRVWVVNPHLVWRGEAKLHAQAMREWAAGVGVPQ
jgi:hypothetical protein